MHNYISLALVTTPLSLYLSNAAPDLSRMRVRLCFKTRRRQLLLIWLYLAKASQVKPRTVPVSANSGCPNMRPILNPAKPQKGNSPESVPDHPRYPLGSPQLGPTEVSLRGCRGENPSQGLTVVFTLLGIPRDPPSWAPQKLIRRGC